MAGSDPNSDFDQLMQRDGVAPLRHSPRADTGTVRLPPAVLTARRRAAEGSADGLGLEILQPVDPHDPLEWKRDGVQEGVYRNLRLGRYRADARLELIRKTLGQAQDELRHFVRECTTHGIRTCAISHGRGRRTGDAASEMRSALNQWLPLLDEVLAFHSAPPEQGGLGVVHVMLRKNEAQRQDNWERHQKRG
ncbi:DNA endonuclease SmrA [Marinobacterium rhizophilum]|uniref:DNA endonuclease SmrA n=1 Tax=Marinobacterium rhizophilum TaxID=420402 RepID=A0ABY5HJK5_9GAMM|nr:DNA endonuclease SmrA [Marinobacterium rhizophilum]UTW12475.1 DNA endonuclease SmrA [Marinobacterium rhizophilum]